MSIPQTPINNAFDFNSSIKPIQANISTICIYCSNKDSIALLADGSFRQCLKCKKHFKPQQIQQQINQNLSQPVSYQTPIFQTMRPIYMPTNDK